ncbi:indolepyruvate oxidoreductase subunit beta [Spirochaetota bacterium]
MRYDIALRGVGGQGGIAISVIIAKAAMAEGLKVKQSEVHGMSQRGGEVSAFLRLSDKDPSSPMIPKGSADLILAFEPLEALRSLPWLKPDVGRIISAASPFKNIPNYPDTEAMLSELKAMPRTMVVDADRLAKEAGNAKTANAVLVGVAARYLPIKAESLEAALREQFASKGEAIVEANLKAFALGRAL